MCYLILLQQPWYKGFTGTIVHTEPQRYLMYGNVARLNTTTIEITELPIGSFGLRPIRRECPGTHAERHREQKRESKAVYHVRNCMTVT